MKSKNMGKRECWIDYVKVFLIYLMIVAHSGHISAMTDCYICSFHMPAFLVISGLLYKPSDNIRQSIKKNAKRLLIPALFFSMLCAVYNGLRLYMQSDLTIETGLIQPFLGLFFYDRVIGFPACGVMWFVVVLFLSKITLDVLFRYCKEWMVALFVCIVVFCASFIQKGDFTYFYYLERWMICLPLVYIGYVMKKYHLLRRMAESKCRYLIIGGDFGSCVPVPNEW